MNFKLANGTYAIPTPQSLLNPGTAAAVGFSAFSQPAKFSENQYLANLDYVLNAKNTLSFKGEYAIAPQIGYFSAGQPPGGGNQALSGTQLESLRATTYFRVT